MFQTKIENGIVYIVGVLIPSEQGNVSNRTRRITLFNQQPTRVVHKKVLPNIGTIYA